ncbi:MAG: thermonuclease family protein [Elainellaceae cyanobacterium]
MRKRAIASLILVSLAALLWTGCSTPRSSEALGISRARASIARVVSGQTVEVLTEGEAATRPVRLAGLNAPDLGQLPWGPDAKRHLEGLLLQQSVILEPAGMDPYGRQIAYLWLDNQLINETLIALGQAMASDTAPEPASLRRGNSAIDQHASPQYTHRLAHAQHRARLLGLGIWDPAAPMRQTPVEFRQQSSSP